MEVVVAAYGAGTDSTAMIVEMVNRGERIDLILFADTDAEKPHTYDYVKLFSDWLKSKGYPEIITVQSVDKNGKPVSLDDHCIKNKMLPSIAYGFKSCSERHKIQPQDKYVPVCQPKPEPTDFEITYKSGHPGDQKCQNQSPALIPRWSLIPLWKNVDAVLSALNTSYPSSNKPMPASMVN